MRETEIEKWNESGGKEHCAVLINAATNDDQGGIKMKLNFQVTDVKKPLLAVRRVVEQGNTVGFGPGGKDNFIKNNKTKDIVLLKPNGRGSYILRVKLEDGSETDITVDSGAEESVCPLEWAKMHDVYESEKKMNLRNANGGGKSNIMGVKKSK